MNGGYSRPVSGCFFVFPRFTSGLRLDVKNNLVRVKEIEASPGSLPFPPPRPNWQGKSADLWRQLQHLMLTMWPRLVLNYPSFCLSLPSAGTGSFCCSFELKPRNCKKKILCFCYVAGFSFIPSKGKLYTMVPAGLFWGCSFCSFDNPSVGA